MSNGALAQRPAESRREARTDLEIVQGAVRALEGFVRDCASARPEELAERLGALSLEREISAMRELRAIAGDPARAAVLQERVAGDITYGDTVLRLISKMQELFGMAGVLSLESALGEPDPRLDEMRLTYSTLFLPMAVEYLGWFAQRAGTLSKEDFEREWPIVANIVKKMNEILLYPDPQENIRSIWLGRVSAENPIPLITDIFGSFLAIRERVMARPEEAGRPGEEDLRPLNIVMGRISTGFPREAAAATIPEEATPVEVPSVPPKVEVSLEIPGAPRGESGLAADAQLNAQLTQSLNPEAQRRATELLANGLLTGTGGVEFINTLLSGSSYPALNRISWDYLRGVDDWNTLGEDVKRALRDMWGTGDLADIRKVMEQISRGDYMGAINDPTTSSSIRATLVNIYEQAGQVEIARPTLALGISGEEFALGRTGRWRFILDPEFTMFFVDYYRMRLNQETLPDGTLHYTIGFEPTGRQDTLFSGGAAFGASYMVRDAAWVTAELGVYRSAFEERHEGVVGTVALRVADESGTLFGAVENVPMYLSAEVTASTDSSIRQRAAFLVSLAHIPNVGGLLFVVREDYFNQLSRTDWFGAVADQSQPDRMRVLAGLQLANKNWYAEALGGAAFSPEQLVRDQEGEPRWLFLGSGGLNLWDTLRLGVTVLVQQPDPYDQNKLPYVAGQITLGTQLGRALIEER